MPHKVDSFASAFGIRRSSEKELAEFEDDARKIVNACSKFDFGGDAVACVERFLGFVSRRDLSPLLGSFLSETVSGPVEAQIVDSAHSQAVARAIATMPHPVHRCLAPGCCATAGKRKHVITRAGTLAAIGEASAAGNVVYKYSYDRFRRTADLSPEGLGQAATFPGFCDGCDNTLFRSVENGAFALDHRSACLLVWRAALNALLRKARQCRGRIYCLAGGNSLDVFGRHGRNSIAHELKQNLSEFRDSVAFRWKLEEEIFRGASSLASAYITLPDPLPYVAAGTFSSRLSLRGCTLQDVNDWRKTCGLIGFNTVRDAAGVHLLFVWERNGAIAPFMDELLGIELDALGGAMLRIVVVFTEFVFFRRAWVEDPGNVDIRAEILKMFDLADLPEGDLILAPLHNLTAIGKGRLDRPMVV